MTSETVRDCSLTRSILWFAEQTRGSRTIPLPDSLDVDHGNEKYMLAIYAPSTSFFKVTSYFLAEPAVTKLTLMLERIDNEKIVTISSIINEVKDDHIHVSGFCQKHDQFVYEIYARGKESVFSIVLDRLHDLPFTFKCLVEEIELTPMKGA